MNGKFEQKEIVGLLKKFKYSKFNAKLSGKSMEPFFNKSKKLKIVYANQKLIKFGDIITFRKSKKICAHRLLGTKNKGGKKFFITKGDNSLGFDEPVNARNMVGKVIELNGRKIHEFPLRQLNVLIALFSLAQGKLFDFFYRKFKSNKFFTDRKSAWQKFLRPAILRATNPALLVPELINSRKG